MVKKVFLTLSVLVLGGCTKVNPGYVGIKVDLMGPTKGVNDLPSVTGFQLYNPMMTDILEYPTFVQTAAWTRDNNEGNPTNEEISFSAEGLIITADVSISYQIRPDKVPAFYVKFRSDDLKKFTHGYLRNVVRDAFNEESVKYTVEQLYGIKKEEFLSAARKRVNTSLEPIGISVEQFGFIGAPRLPQNVVNAINGKIAAIQAAQQTENELRRIQAEALKQIAAAEGEAKSKIARAEGEAKSNLILANSLTPVAMEWKRLQLQQEAISRWKGDVPQYNGGSMPIPFLNMGGK